jgi:hypothetical protein
MDDLIKEIEENISGIWGNSQYELILGLPPQNVFSLIVKKGTEAEWKYLDGDYFIVLPSESPYLTLRLVELTGIVHDYVINEIIAFDTLIISQNGEKIHFKNIPPDEYDGEVFNPSDN